MMVKICPRGRVELKRSNGACGCGHDPAAAPKLAHARAKAVPEAGNKDPLTELKSRDQGPLTAAMVENTEYGRAQYELDSADVVHEAGTKFFYYSCFMALYYGNEPGSVGPERWAGPLRCP